MKSSLSPGDRVTRSRVRLILTQPFLGTLALNLRMIESEHVPTMGVDGRRLFYNPKFIEGITDAELQGVVAHEIMHCVYQHVLEWRSPKTREHPQLWTMACEYVVNDAVLNMFHLTLPDINGAKPYVDAKYKGMYTEEVYQLLLKDAKESGGSSVPSEEDVQAGMIDVHINGGMGDDGKESKDGKGVSKEELEALSRDLKLAISKAATVARMKGDLPGDLARIIDVALEAKISWKQVLAQFVTGVSNDDYSWRNANRRHIARGIILPSLRSETLEVAVAIDTSGSIGEKELSEFWAEIKGIMGAFPSYKIHFMACDAHVHAYQELTTHDNEVEMGDVMKGGGGTSFIPVFDKIEEESIRPRCLIYLTDTYGAFPDEPPSYPVLWVVLGNGDVPWGMRCELGD